MTRLIEKVARAICRSRSCEGAACCEWPANRGRIECPVKRGEYDHAAREAIMCCDKSWPPNGDRRGKCERGIKFPENEPCPECGATLGEFCWKDPSLAKTKPKRRIGSGDYRFLGLKKEQP